MLSRSVVMLIVNALSAPLCMYVPFFFVSVVLLPPLISCPLLCCSSLCATSPPLHRHLHLRHAREPPPLSASRLATLTSEHTALMPPGHCMPHLHPHPTFCAHVCHSHLLLNVSYYFFLLIYACVNPHPSPGEEVPKDAHLWEFGDSGSILVMVNDEQLTDHLLFTTNEGLNWWEYKLMDEKIRVYSIVTVLSDTSR